MRRLRVLAAFALSGVASLAGTSVVLAAWTGQVNGRDLAINGWIGSDEPNNPPLQGSYSFDNIRQDGILKEWAEPTHDWVSNEFMRWGQAAKDKLNREADQKGLGIELTIDDQDFYDFNGIWNSNVPWSKGAENENAVEEFIQGYTEVDIEIQDPSRINVGVDYWTSYQIDAERDPTPTRPDFGINIEWCDNNFTTHCFYDAVSWWRKKQLVR